MRCTLVGVVLAGCVLVSSQVKADPCTDGLDCLCDTLVATDPDVVFCEDFENDRLQEDQGWAGGPGSSPPYGGWRDQKYAGIDSNCLPNGELRNLEGTADPNQCFNITNLSGDSEAVPLADAVFDGEHSFAQRNVPNETHGLHGKANWDGGPYTHFGVTMAIYYSSNLEFSGPAWKPDEYSPARWPILGVSGTRCPFGREVPYQATMWWSSLTPVYNTAIGNVCASGNKIVGRPDSLDYQFTPDLWRCRQVHYAGWGSTAGRIRHWWDNRLVLDVQDIDMTQPDGNPAPSPNGISAFEWNNFFNGVQNSGYSGSDVSVRMKDNVVVSVASEPVSCESIGFDFAGLAGLGAPDPLTPDTPSGAPDPVD